MQGTSAKTLHVGSWLDTRTLGTSKVVSAWVRMDVVVSGVSGFAMPLQVGRGVAWHKKVKVGTEGRNSVGMDWKAMREEAEEHMFDNYGDDYTNARLSFPFLLLASRSCGVENGPCGVEVVHKVDVEIVGAGMDLSYESRKQNGEVGVVVVVGGNTKILRMAVEDSPS